MTTLERADAAIWKCSGCDAALPLRDAAESETARDWFCSGCGAEASGLLKDEYDLDELRALRPESIPFDQEQIPEPAFELEQLAYDLGQSDSTGKEQRAAERRDMIRVLPAVGVDRSLQPVGDPFNVVSRNISTQGIAVLAARAIDGDLLVVELAGAPNPTLQVLAHVVRQRPTKCACELGGRLLTRFQDRNSSG